LKNGFVLLVVIMILFLLASELFFLTGGSNKIAFQTNQAFLQAVEQNMIAGGLAWAGYNIKEGNIKNAGSEIQLDAGGLGIQNARLTAAIEKIAGKQAEVIINTSCDFGRYSLKSSKKYIVPRTQK
jgi:hypothetical protein